MEDSWLFQWNFRIIWSEWTKDENFRIVVKKEIPGQAGQLGVHVQEANECEQPNALHQIREDAKESYLKQRLAKISLL